MRTDSHQYAMVGTAPSTHTAIPFPLPGTTEPSGEGVLDLQGNPNLVELVFTSTHANNTAHTIWVRGIRKIDTLWVRRPIVKLDGTVGTTVGVAGAQVNASTRFLDSIARTSGDSDTKVISFDDGQPAHVTVDPQGCQKIEVLGTTGLNALAATL